MSPYESSLLQAIPEPALVARSNRIEAFNSAASVLFSGLAQGAPVPECLLCTPPAAALVLAGGQTWHMSAAPLDGSVLYLLHVARHEAASLPQLDGVMRSLRQQLAHLMLSTQLLGRSLPEEGDCAARLAGMNRSLCRLLRLTERLDLLRNMEADTFTFLPVTLDLAGLCREVTAAVEGLLDELDLSIRFESPLSTLLVSGDSTLLEKLLLELIANAAGAAKPESCLTLSLARRDNRALLTLSGDHSLDRGGSLVRMLAGDPPLDHIPSAGEGAGLGLALAQQVVALHNGTLMMERQNGIRVTVALPLCPSNAPLSVRTPRADYAGGFAPALIELSDLLPDRAFAYLDVE
ncbi:MAG: HAMP domain-containing histidine kinase [Oscillospiraceae bacterium]|nr:HAMP domain-containing histidine kinase [Oscillospiraceae bacterium]